MSRNDDQKLFNYRIRRVVASPLLAVIAWGESCFPPEELRKMAGIGVAHVERHILGVARQFSFASRRPF